LRFPKVLGCLLVYLLCAYFVSRSRLLLSIDTDPLSGRTPQKIARQPGQAAD
jgi:hypothetical protein